MRYLVQLPIIILGLGLLCSTAIVSFGRQTTEDVYLMVISSNIRDYDQALYLTTPQGTVLRRLTRIPGAENVVAQSPNGKWLLVRSNVNYNTYSINVSNSAVHEVADYYTNFLTISADSRWGYFQRAELTPSGNYASVLYRIGLNGGPREDIAMLTDGYPIISLSPDSRWLYVFGNSFNRINTHTHEVQVIQSDGINGFAGLLGWSGDGEWMYIQYQSFDQLNIYRMRSDGGDQALLLPTEAGSYVQLIFGPEDEQLFALINGSETQRLYGMRPDGSNLRLIAENVGTFMGWTADAEWALFFGQNDGGVSSLFRLHVTDGERQVVVNDAYPSFWWSPDRKQLLFPLNTTLPSPDYSLIDVESGQRQGIPYETNMGFRTWSPDGEWIYFEKFTDKSSELYRVNILTNTRQAVHRPALHNNYEYIFQTWLPVTKLRWEAWKSGIIGSMALLVGLMISRLGELLKRKRSGNSPQSTQQSRPSP